MTTQLQSRPQQQTVEQILSNDSFKKRFEEVLGKKAPGFVSSVISAYKTNAMLREADPMSVVSAAMVAATLDLPINSNLGFAHIVPYRDKSGKAFAQFQMGWKGFIQLAIRTGQYKNMNASVVYEGELVSYNRITGEAVFDMDLKRSDKVIGYVAFFRLINGFEKTLYMTVAETEAHGMKYSKSFSSPQGKWKQDFDAMSIKTVVKMLLGKWGILSVELQKALVADQGTTSDGETFDYPDNPSDDIPASAAEAEMPRARVPQEVPAEVKEEPAIIPEVEKRPVTGGPIIGESHKKQLKKLLKASGQTEEWLVDQCEAGDPDKMTVAEYTIVMNKLSRMIDEASK